MMNGGGKRGRVHTALLIKTVYAINPVEQGTGYWAQGMAKSFDGKDFIQSISFIDRHKYRRGYANPTGRSSQAGDRPSLPVPQTRP